MPEINVRGHAGGWARSIPRIVIPCEGFVCEKGHGLTLNVSHPQVQPIIRDTLVNVKSIWGKDELHMSSDCFDELGLETDKLRWRIVVYA
jgi:hypothetical protein